MLHDKADALTTKQFAILIFIAGAAGKLFSLPAAFVKSGGRSSWAALAICLAVDLAMLALFLIASHKNPNKTAFELVEQSCGKIVAKIIFFVVMLYLLLKTLSLILMVSDFGGRELFMGVPSVLMLLPLALLLYVFGRRGFRPIGRTAEIMIYFLAAALLCLILLVHKSADITKIMPPFGEGSIASPLARFPFLACGDFTALYFVLGRVKKSKGFTWAVSGAAVAAAIVVIVFSVLSFAALMNLRTITPDTVVTVVTRTSTSRLGFGRIDKIAFAVFSIAPALTAGIFFRAAVLAASYSTGIRCPITLSVTLSLAVFIVALAVGEAGVLEFVSRFGLYFAPLFFVGIPLLFFILSMIQKRGNLYENSR